MDVIPDTSSTIMSPRFATLPIKPVASTVTSSGIVIVGAVVSTTEII